ncbi:MAG: polysaccharide deacetylase family protein [Planctomycetota bacterium]
MVQNAFTVDLEDWYHVCAVEDFLPQTRWDEYESRVVFSTQLLLDLLEQYHYSATFFVLGYIAKRHPELIQEIHRRGHEIASHGYAHQPLVTITPEVFRADLKKSIEIVEKLTGKRPVGYRAPEWTVVPETLWALDVLIEEGFLYDSSMMPLTLMGDRHLNAYPHRIHRASGSILEFPATTMRCLWESLPFTGGLPLRMSPYWYTVTKINFMNAIKIPTMVYVHPWEMDPNPPKMKLPRTRAFMHYFHLKSVPQKIRGLLERFEFTTLENLMKSFFVPATQEQIQYASTAVRSN